MRLGMTLPVMEPDLWAEGPATLEAWARAVDDGPFASLCLGERVAFDSPDTVALLGALAAWTTRVRLVTTVVVPQLHDPVMLAKALATVDQLCGGRLTVGLGVGGREEDYRAAGADLATQTVRGLAERAESLRRVWRGDDLTGATRPVGPPPVQDGGPPLLVGTTGPRTLRSAARWADGLAGVTLDLDVDAVAAQLDLARSAWAEAARPAPWLATSFWFALGEPDAARAQLHRHLRHYLNWLPDGLAEAMARSAGFAGSAAELADVLRRLADVGCDEVHLIPTSSDVTQVAACAEVAQLLA